MGIDIDVNDDDVEQKDIEQKEDEDDDLNVSIKNKKRRITPTWEGMVFNRDLILNKVPILKRKDLNDESKSMNGPIFLNADQYEKLNKNKVIEEKKSESSNQNKEENKKECKQNNQQNQQNKQNEENKESKDNKVNKENKEKEDNKESKDIKRINEENEDGSVWSNNGLMNENTKSTSWAKKLFGQQMKKNKILKQKEDKLLIEKKKEERQHQIKIDSI